MDERQATTTGTPPHHGTPPLPIPLQVSQNGRVSAHLDLPASQDRVALADRAVATLVSAWGLPALRSQRWLAAAEPLLADTEPLELFVQLDRVSSIVTLELWHSGARVFGIDDWVGF